MSNAFFEISYLPVPLFNVRSNDEPSLKSQTDGHQSAPTVMNLGAYVPTGLSVRTVKVISQLCAKVKAGSPPTLVKLLKGEATTLPSLAPLPQMLNISMR